MLVKGPGTDTETSGPSRSSLDNNLKAHRELVLYRIKKSGNIGMDITFLSSFTVGFLLSYLRNSVSLHKCIGLGENYWVRDTAITNPIQGLGKWLVLFF